MGQVWPSLVADFKQRTRQQSFVITLLVMSVLTLLFFPAPDAHYQTLVITGYRGSYNSAWIGICLAMLNLIFLPLICFYLVKNALALDRQSKTCELIAATPISKHTFLFAKWCTSVVILVSIVLVMLVSSVLIQLYYGESYHIELWALVWPQLVFVLPMLLAIAAIALMFETINWLKGGLGNLLYVFLWMGSIGYSVESLSGIGALLAHLEAEVAERFPLQQGDTNVGVSISNESNPINTFVWQGMEPTINHLWAALPFVFICLCCLALTWLFFDRFSHNAIAENNHTSWLSLTLKTKVASRLDTLFLTLTKYFAFTRLLRLELKLILKGHSVYWFIGLLGLNMLQLIISQSLLVSLLLPLSWLWCVLLISQLGQVEKQANTLELITYSKQSCILPSLASYSAAWLLLAVASIGSLIRFTGSAQWLLLLQLLIAISFTVSLAYFCGAFTGTKRMFEVLYPTLWYVGPIQAALYVDFFGVNSQVSWAAGIPYYFFVISIGLFILAVMAKKPHSIFRNA